MLLWLYSVEWGLGRLLVRQVRDTIAHRVCPPTPDPLTFLTNNQSKRFKVRLIFSCFEDTVFLKTLFSADGIR